MNVFFPTVVVAPYIIISIGYLVLLCAAFGYPMTRRHIFPPLLGSFILTAAFVIFEQYSIRTSRSSTAAIGYIFLPGMTVAVAFIAFVILWSLFNLASLRIASFRTPTSRLRSIFLTVLSLLILSSASFAGGSWLVRHRLIDAASTSTDPAALEKILARADPTGDMELLSSLAKNPAMPPADLTAIFDSCKSHLVDFNPQEYVVFCSLAQNPQTPPEILAALGDCRQATVRIMVAGNPSVPRELLLKLAQDADQSVRHFAAIPLQKRHQN